MKRHGESYRSCTIDSATFPSDSGAGSEVAALDVGAGNGRVSTSASRRSPCALSASRSSMSPATRMNGSAAMPRECETTIDSLVFAKDEIYASCANGTLWKTDGPNWQRVTSPKGVKEIPSLSVTATASSSPEAARFGAAARTEPHASVCRACPDVATYVLTRIIRPSAVG